MLVRPHHESVPSVALSSMRDTWILTELVGLECDIPIFSLRVVQVVWTTEEVNHTGTI